MLAELAAANAAFSVIKQAVQNSGDIAKAGSAIAKFVGAKEDLQKKASKKGGGSDLEEFMALEQIREKEEQLKQFMIYCGRPGLWGDWQRFQAKARIARREAEEATKRKRKQILEITIVTFLFIVGLSILGCIVLLALHSQGKI
jgi:molecular chaperone GrpE (heat shock protein)